MPRTAPPLSRILTLATMLSIAALLAPVEVQAACTPNPATMDGENVTCTGSDDGLGFDAGAFHDVRVDVLSGPAVTNPGNDVLQLNDGAVGERNFLVNSGTVEAGAGNSAVQGNDWVHVQNGTPSQTGTISVTSGAGAGSIGVEIHDHGLVDNYDGTIEINADSGGVAISGNDDNGVFNYTAGEITVVGDDARAIVLNDDNQVQNDGTITVSGSNSQGIVLGGNNVLLNTGLIDLSGATGANSHAVVVSGSSISAPGDDANIDNVGTIRGGDDPTSGAVIAFNTSMGELNKVLNQVGGRIESGGTTAILGGAGDEIVINWGAIVGDVDLAAGDDLFELSASGQRDRLDLRRCGER